jgi:hypothetical protein
MRAQEGLFQAAGNLVRDPLTDEHTASQLDALRSWFGDNLEKPDTFTRSSGKRDHYRDTKGLSWFKPSAKNHISKMFELKTILEANGYGVKVLKEGRVGYIVYEDEFQIVAEPFADTNT